MVQLMGMVLYFSASRLESNVGQALLLRKIAVEPIGHSAQTLQCSHPNHLAASAINSYSRYYLKILSL